MAAATFASLSSLAFSDLFKESTDNTITYTDWGTTWWKLTVFSVAIDDAQGEQTVPGKLK